MLPGHYAYHYNSSALINHYSLVCSFWRQYTHKHTHIHNMVSFIRRADLSFDLTQKSFCHEELEIRDWPDMHPPPPSPPLSAFVFTFVSNFPYQPTDSFILTSFFNSLQISSFKLVFLIVPVWIWPCASLYLLLLLHSYMGHSFYGTL